MERVSTPSRADVAERLKRLGRRDYRRPDFPFFGWNEAAYYSFSTADIHALTTAAEAVELIIRQALDAVLLPDVAREVGFERTASEMIASTWRHKEPALISRLDFGFDGSGDPKLFEYHADTPNFILEAGCVQRKWAEETQPGASQFNFLEEALITTLQKDIYPRECHVVAFDDIESSDMMSYLVGLLGRGGITAHGTFITEIDTRDGYLFDDKKRAISTMVKCFGWEDVILPRKLHTQLAHSNIKIIEPAWKALASSKRFLAILWELFPQHPNLIHTTTEEGCLESEVVKSALSSGGHGIEVRRRGALLAKVAGTNMFAPFISQEFIKLRRFEGYIPTVSVWTVAGKACCIGVREDLSPITNIVTSSFVPHILEGSSRNRVGRTRERARKRERARRRSHSG